MADPTPATQTTEPQTPNAKKKQRAHDALLKALMNADDDGDPPMKLLTPGGAQLLLGWLIARKGPLPKDPRELIAYAKQLRATHPTVWKPLSGMNFIGFASACRLCGLEATDAAALQNACTELA